MRILTATHLGMCFGVRDAIKLALEQSRKEPLTILGELVHNKTVLADLQRQGVRIEQDASQVDTPTVMITAHGASDAARARVRQQGLKVVEATCPLVHVAHRAVRHLVEAGYYPVIIGKKDHVEVRGMTEDLAEFGVVSTDEDVRALPSRPQFGVAAQTTQPIERVRRLVDRIRQQFPDSDVRFMDTVCQPTKQRQTAAIELASQCEVVVVIGGANSNNTRELAETCRQQGARAYHVQTVADLRPEWFGDDDTVGVTAGTSTPDKLIAEVVHFLQAMSVERTPAVVT